MVESGWNRHLDISELESLLDGSLSSEEENRLRGHIDECSRCRLELAMLARFREVDKDAELEKEARWGEASRRLDDWEEALFEERERVEAGGPGEVAALSGAEEIPGTDTGHGRYWRDALGGWLAPAAALVAVILIFLAIGRSPRGKFLENGGVVRGVSAEKSSIELVAPLGELKSLPDTFRWRAKEPADYFAIDVFTSDLESVVSTPEVENPWWAVPDSLRSRIEGGTIYIWNVKGYKGLERSASSKNGWFRVTEVK